MSGKRAIQKRSKGAKPKREYFSRFRLDDGPALTGLGVAASSVGAMALQGVASFAGGFAGTLAAVEAGRRRFVGMGSSPLMSGVSETGPAGPAASAPPAPAGAAPASRFGAAMPGFRFSGGVRPGAVRDFLRARFPGQKPHLAVAGLTGIPEGTVRGAMAWNGPSELSGAHMLRLVAVFGPPFLAAVLDPVPDWVAAAMQGEGKE